MNPAELNKIEASLPKESKKYADILLDSLERRYRKGELTNDRIIEMANDYLFEIVSKSKIKLSLLSEWINYRIRERMEQLVFEKHYDKFFGIEVDDGLSYQLIGMPEFPKLKIITREGERITIENAGWDLVRLVSTKDEKYANIGNFILDQEEKRKYDGDNLWLAKKTITPERKYGIFLINSRVQVERELKQGIVEKYFLEDYVQEQIKGIDTKNL